MDNHTVSPTRNPIIHRMLIKTRRFRLGVCLIMRPISALASTFGGLASALVYRSTIIHSPLHTDVSCTPAYSLVAVVVRFARASLSSAVVATAAGVRSSNKPGSSFPPKTPPLQKTSLNACFN